MLNQTWALDFMTETLTTAAACACIDDDEEREAVSSGRMAFSLKALEAPGTHQALRAQIDVGPFQADDLA